MLRKKEAFTVITPIPGFIPRQLALDILHSHSEVITLNPLVLDHKPIPAPRNAISDEFYSTWYEITEKIQFVPGVGGMGAGKITFTACFHDMPWGLQTHIYAPFHVDLRYRYQVAGNQPGIEDPLPPEQREIGLESLGAPQDGLYLREDIEYKCNMAMAGFVKSQAKAANKQMVERIVKKAELLDAGILQAMMQDGRLKTFNPNDLSQLASNRNDAAAAVPHIPSPIGSPRPASWVQQPPPPPSPHAYPYHQILTSPELPTQRDSSGRGREGAGPAELPGDSQHYRYYHTPPQPLTVPLSGHPQEFTLDYQGSASSSNPRWSQSQLSPCLTETHRSSMSSTVSGAGSMPHVSSVIASELPTHAETKAEQ
ncbi:hypothetical protein E4U21_001859 [Claviceps maximensis]|nr:hypothetical protein E4U21_001859 [Claviceps maximensis]